MKQNFKLSPLMRALCALIVSGSALAQTEVSAVLAGHAYLPASTTVQAPKAAGPLFATAGKFTDASRQRKDTPGSVEGITFVGDPKYPRKSGGSLPVAVRPHWRLMFFFNLLFFL